MSSPTLAEFRLRFPEFSATSDEVAEMHLSDAALECAARAWGAFWARGVQLLAAHLLAVSLAQQEALSSMGALGGAAAGGGVASMATGRESISFGAAGSAVSGRADLSTGDALLATTRYGQEHLRLRKRLAIAPRVI